MSLSWCRMNDCFLLLCDRPQAMRALWRWSELKTRVRVTIGPQRPTRTTLPYGVLMEGIWHDGWLYECVFNGQTLRSERLCEVSWTRYKRVRVFQVVSAEGWSGVDRTGSRYSGSGRQWYHHLQSLIQRSSGGHQTLSLQEMQAAVAQQWHRYISIGSAPWCDWLVSSWRSKVKALWFYSGQEASVTDEEKHDLYCTSVINLLFVRLPSRSLQSPLTLWPLRHKLSLLYFHLTRQDVPARGYGSDGSL